MQSLRKRAKTLERKIQTENLTLAEENHIIAEIGELEGTLKALAEQQKQSQRSKRTPPKDEDLDMGDDD